jgi:hypothetical protein
MIFFWENDFKRTIGFNPKYTHWLVKSHLDLYELQSWVTHNLPNENFEGSHFEIFEKNSF